MEPIDVPGAPWVLRPWRDDDTDAAALAAAWADDAVRRHCAVPPGADLVTARRWVAGWAERRRRGLALDLVVSEGRDGVPLGEVGLWPHELPPDAPVEGRVLEVGWWTAAGHRGRGQASAAARALLEWAGSHLAVERVVARIGSDNPAAEAVARSAGMEAAGTPRAVVGEGGPGAGTVGGRLWSRRLRGGEGRPTGERGSAAGR